MKYIIPDIVTTYVGKNYKLCKGFAKGCGGKIVPVTMFPNIVATYGILRGTAPVLKNSKEYWYIDHGYFGENFWRITRNNILHRGNSEYPSDRLHSFKFKFKKWKTSGKYVLICPPSKLMSEFLELNNWLTNIITRVRKYTDREIVISRKQTPVKTNPQLFSPLEKKLKHVTIQEGLKNAWCLITDHSNAMIEALIEGVPIICTNINRRIGDIQDIEYPVYNRDFLKGLAYNQWNLKQIKSGQAWRELNERE